MVEREGHPRDADQALGRAEQHVGPRRQRVVVHAAGHLDADEAAQGGEQAAHGQDEQSAVRSVVRSVWAWNCSRCTISRTRTAAHTARVMMSAACTTCSTSVPLSNATATIHERRCPRQDAPRQHDHPDPGDGDQGARGLHHGDGQVLRNQVQVGAQGRGDRGEQVDHAGHEERDGRDAPDAAHADAVRGHFGRRWPRGAAGPSGGQLGVDIGRLRTALDDDVRSDQPLAQGGHGQVRLGQQEAHMQVGSGLDLERRLLAVVQEGGWKAEAPSVLVDHLGGGARAGEEPGVEVGELGHQRTTDDHPRRAGLDRLARHVEGVPAVHVEQRVRDGRVPDSRPDHGAGRPSPPRARQMPREVTATTMASTTRSATAMATVTKKRENHEASYGALERVLLAGGPEDVSQAVDDELDPQQERDGGQHEGRGPQVATEPAVEEARRDEAAGQARVVEPFQADQPGPVFGATLVEGWVGAGPQRAGAHEHRADPRPRFADQVHRGVHGDPELLERTDESRIVVGGEHGDHLGIGTGREGAQGLDEGGVGTQRRGGLVVGAHDRCHQAPAEDHDARPLPFLEPPGDVAAAGPGGVGRLGREQQVTEHLDPAAQGHLDAMLAPRRQIRVQFPSGGDGAAHGISHRVTSGRSPRPLSACRRFSGGAERVPLRWTFVPPTPQERTNWTWRDGVRNGGPAVVFDIDGVLSDAAGRQHFIESGRRDWHAFFEACGDDQVIEEIATLLELLDSSLAVILLTGRPAAGATPDAGLARALRVALGPARDALSRRLRAGHLVQADGRRRAA